MFFIIITPPLTVAHVSHPRPFIFVTSQRTQSAISDTLKGTVGMVSSDHIASTMRIIFADNSGRTAQGYHNPPSRTVRITSQPTAALTRHTGLDPVSQPARAKRVSEANTVV